jgi:hypothetical protein
MSPVVRQLVLKDLRLNLPIMLMMVGAGVLALALMYAGRAGYAVGGILFITANLAGGIFIGMYCIMQERKDQSTLFALSLPVTANQLDSVKLLTALLVYGLPWLALTLAVFTSVLLFSPPDGSVIYSLLIQGCAFAISSAYFSVLATSRSEAVVGFCILVLNMGFSLFIVTFSQPALRDPLQTDRIVVPDYAALTLAIELLVIVAAPLIAVFVLSRRRDYFR